MRAVHIDWVKDERHKSVWIVLCLIICIAVGAAGGYALKLRRDTETVDRDIARLQSEFNKAIETRGLPSTPLPQYASLVEAAQLLSLDLNPVFSAVEGIDIPGVLLQHLSIDAKNGDVRVDYEMDDFARVSELDEVLNAGLDDRPWKHERATAGAAGFQGAAVRGSWRLSIRKPLVMQKEGS